MTHQKPFRVLLVEDNPADVLLTTEAFKDGEIDIHLDSVEDGEDAMAFLRREGAYEGAPSPHMILLDLNLPRKDGREVLQELKEDPDLRHIPVVILSSSRAERDVLESYRLHANSYVSKPVDMNEFSRVVRAIDAFWLRVARVPAPF
jgi:CheY-like chemotaxis protein